MTVIEWGIQWLAPEDIAGTITPVSTFSQAHSYSRMLFGQRGEVVSRSVTYSDWSKHDSE